jgi:hypothetical protein
LPARKSRKLCPAGIDVLAVTEHEVHRHVEHVVDVALVAEAVLEHERQHAGAVRVGVDQMWLRYESMPLGLPSVNGELANSAVASGCSARPTRNFFAMLASEQ